MPRRSFALTAPAQPVTRLGCEPLEDRSVPANLAMTDVFVVDSSNAPQAAPVYGQQVGVRANWVSQAMTGSEPAVPVRYTADYPAGYFTAGSPAQSWPLSANGFNHGTGDGSWNWRRSGWYAGTAAFTVTATVDPNDVIAETNEADNSFTVTLNPVAPATLPGLLVQPVAAAPGRDWTINNYADVDPRNGTLADYRLGTNTYDGHDAIDAGPADFAAQDRGVPLVAVLGGTVVTIDGGSNFDRETSWNGGQNWNAVWVDHGNGWKSVYGHMAADSMAVQVGTAVKAGQMLGLMGSSGVSTGTHIHYTLYYRNQPVEAGFSPASYWAAPLPYASDAPGVYIDAGLTNYSPYANAGEMLERPAQYTQVGTTAPGSTTMYFYIQGYNLKSTDVMHWTWVRPDGTTLNTSSFSPNANYKYSTWWYTRSQSLYQGSPGTWQVILSLNGTAPANEQRRLTFDVVPGAGTGSIRVNQNTATGYPVIDGRTSPVALGTAALGGAAPDVTLAVTNHGSGPLTLGPVAVPFGVVVVSAPATVAAGTTGTIVLRLSTNVVPGRKFGTVRFTTSDPDALLYEFAVAGTLTGAVVPGTPVLATPGPSTVRNTGSAPRPLFPNATVTDSDSADLAGGQLTAQFASFQEAGDLLGVRNTGTGAGQIGVSGNAVTYGGITIGSFAQNGAGGAPVVVNLLAGATPTAVQALVRSLTYQTTAGTPTTQRKGVLLGLVDNTGKPAVPVFGHVINSGVTKNPAVAALPNRVVTNGATFTQTGSFTDPFGSSWTATADYGDGTGDQPVVVNPDKTFTLSHAYTAGPGNPVARVTVTSDLGGTHTQAMLVNVTSATVLGPIYVNLNTAQRSRVTVVDVFVPAGVTLPADVASAFALAGPAANGPVALTAAVLPNGSNGSIVRLTFSGAGTEFGSLKDGRHTLTVNAALVLDPNGFPVDGNGDGLSGGNTTFAFHRLFGDVDGSAATDTVDLARFRQAFSGAVPDLAFDFNADGLVDTIDLGRFRQRFGVVLP